ncbi:unnamed protein product [Paramecium pentaurelia]|uniref:Uncharacterized protein n=1 Tax=Paramecium pentaurelia TaxID=43138 RepID=A0A8S1SU80_9CILI|nr:unnamed protein product [Paramecium pentaurelia]
MKINERFQYQSKQEEINLDKEASDIAQRIMEKVRQRSTAKSDQKELASQYLRASDYKARQLFKDNQIEIRRQSEKVTKGTSQQIGRKEEIFVPEFKISKDNKPYDLARLENQLRMEDIKTPIKIPLQLNGQGFKDAHQKTVKINNYESMGFQEQKNVKWIQIMNEQTQPSNCQIHQLSSKRMSSPKRNHPKLDSNYQTKSQLYLKTTQLQTPISVQHKQSDIVSQLLGSLKNQNRNYVEQRSKR